MNIEKIEKNGTSCAVVRSNEVVIVDSQSALDLLMIAKYEIGTKNIAIDKKLIKEDFFILSSDLAGEILQKYISFGGGDSIFKVHRERVPSIGRQREGLFFNPLTNQLGNFFRFVRRNFEKFL